MFEKLTINIKYEVFRPTRLQFIIIVSNHNSRMSHYYYIIKHSSTVYIIFRDATVRVQLINGKRLDNDNDDDGRKCYEIGLKRGSLGKAIFIWTFISTVTFNFLLLCELDTPGFIFLHYFFTHSHIFIIPRYFFVPLFIKYFNSLVG